MGSYGACFRDASPVCHFPPVKQSVGVAKSPRCSGHYGTHAVDCKRLLRRGRRSLSQQIAYLDCKLDHEVNPRPGSHVAYREVGTV
jgi:hypothetical protein